MITVENRFFLSLFVPMKKIPGVINSHQPFHIFKSADRFRTKEKRTRKTFLFHKKAFLQVISLSVTCPHKYLSSSCLRLYWFVCFQKWFGDREPDIKISRCCSRMVLCSLFVAFLFNSDAKGFRNGKYSAFSLFISFVLQVYFAPFRLLLCIYGGAFICPKANRNNHSI